MTEEQINEISAKIAKLELSIVEITSAITTICEILRDINQSNLCDNGLTEPYPKKNNIPYEV